MLCEPIIAGDWEEYDDGGDETAIIDSGHPLSVYHLDTILRDPDTYADRPASRIFGAEETAELISAHLLGTVAQEPGHIIKQGGVFTNYAHRTLQRLKKEEDSGILHPEAISIYRELSDVEKKSVDEIVTEAAERMEGFPNIGKMNVVFTNENVSVDVGPTMLEMLIPAVVETRKGLAAVVPTITGILQGETTYATAGAAEHIMGSIRGADISQVHLWDIGASRVRRIPLGDLDEAVATIARMCRNN